MFWIPLAIAAGAQLLSGHQQSKQKKAQADDQRRRSYRVNAAYANRAEAIRRKGRRVVGEARNVISSGNVAFSGSVAAMISTSLYETEVDVANTLREGTMAADDLQMQAKYGDKEADNIMLSSMASAAGTVFGGMG